MRKRLLTIIFIILALTITGGVFLYFSSNGEFTESAQEARDSQRFHDLQSLRLAPSIYRGGQGSYPKTLAEPISGYLAKLPADPRASESFENNKCLTTLAYDTFQYRYERYNEQAFILTACFESGFVLTINSNE